MKRLTLLSLLTLLLATSAFGQEPDPVFSASLSANGIWFHADEDQYPSDFELGTNVAASFQPNIALAAGVFYGIDNSYVRALVGPRFTASNPENKNLALSLGIAYHLSSEEDIRPQEWATDASVGWVPWPALNKNVILGLQGNYGLTSNQAHAIAAVRYKLGGAR